MAEPKKTDSKVTPKVVAGSKAKRRWGFVALEGAAIVFLLVVLALVACVWRISTGPLDIAFAKPAIQEALRDSESGMRVDFDEAALHWPDLQGPLLLGLRGGKVYTGEDKLVVAIDSAALSLNKAKLLIGRVSPEGLILRKPSVLLKRSVDNQFSIGLTSGVANGNTGSATSQVSLDDVFEVFGSPQSDGNGRLAALKLVRIEGARVLIDDMVLSRSWEVPRVDFALMRERAGLRTVFDVDLPRRLNTSTTVVPNVEGDAFVGWGDDVMQVESVLSNFHVGFLSDKVPELEALAAYDVRMDATVKAVLGRDFSVKKAETVVFSKGGSLELSEFGDEPLPYKDFGFRAVYDADEKAAKIDGMKVTARDVTLNAQADFTHLDGGFGAGFEGKGRVEIAELAHAKIPPLWPKSLEEDNAKEWVVDKLSEGVFSNVFANFGVVGAPDEEGVLSIDLNHLQAGFDFKNLSAKYKSTMAPVKKGAGKGSFDYKSETLRINIDSAQILDMAIPEAELEFTNIIQAGKGQADLNIKVDGPFQSMLRYLSDEPVGLELDADLKDVRGDINASVNLQFPTVDDIPKKDIKINVTGEVRDAHLPKVMKDLPLSGGPYAIKVENGEFKLKGKGQLDGRDIDLDYREFLFSDGKPYSSKVVARLNGDQALRDKLGIDLSDFLEGAAFVDVTYTKKNDGSAVADVKADITASRLFLDPFDYEKVVGQPGEATLKAHLQDDELVKVTDLRATAPGVVLESSSLGFRTKGGETELSAGKISRFQVGQTIGGIEFEVTDAGLLKLAMKGPFLDMRPFLNDDGKKDEPYKAPPMQISVDAAQMRASDDGVLQKGQLYADIDAEGHFNQMELDAVAGAGQVYMRFKPDASGKRVFRLEADDAGATLKAFEVYDNIRGGKLVIYGEPIRGIYDRNLIGKAEVTDFKIVNAPGLARIMGALSLTGAAEMLSSDGLNFTKLEADFDWLFRPNGSLLVLKDGRTSGNSLGLTFAGTFDNAESKIDVKGTIIPLSGINDVISKIPLVGDILTGGSGGIFAATYSIKGEGKEPEVSVNPLSVLAPGILRRILFEQN